MTRILTVSLVTLGDPGRQTGGYRYHRRMAELAPACGAEVRFVSFPDRPFPLPALAGPAVLRQTTASDVLALDSITPSLPPGCSGGRARRWAAASTSRRAGSTTGRRGGWRRPGWTASPGAGPGCSWWPARPSATSWPARGSRPNGSGWSRRAATSPRPGRPAARPPAGTPGRAAVGRELGRAQGLPGASGGGRAAPGRAGHPAPGRGRPCRPRLRRPGQGAARPAGPGRAGGRPRPPARRAGGRLCTRRPTSSPPQPAGAVRDRVGEAMAAGLPVVGWRAGNLPHLAADGREGLLADPGDVAALSAALARLATDEELRRRLAAAAESRAATGPPGPSRRRCPSGVRPPRDRRLPPPARGHHPAVAQSAPLQHRMGVSRPPAGARGPALVGPAARTRRSRPRPRRRTRSRPPIRSAIPCRAARRASRSQTIPRSSRARRPTTTSNR